MSRRDRERREEGGAGDPGEVPGPSEGPVPERRLHLWEGYGVEIEMMIVDAETLDVRPVADRLFAAVGGGPDEEIVAGGVGWSNELALHVLELKTHGPTPTLDGWASRFQASVAAAEEALAPMGCRLLPGGAHPWMDPLREFRLWPHEHTEVYRAFDRIFSCRGHGWANLQSTHLNLPFAGDPEFARLHEAVRVVMPLLPALAASSPILDGQVAPVLDARMSAYRDNARIVPSVTGRVVPERVDSEGAYRERILGTIYRDMEALDPEGVLRHEWVNARGAIARFQRGAVEVRVLDAQESPLADLAVVGAVAGAIRRVAAVLEAEPGASAGLDTEALAALLDRVVRDGRRASTAPVDYGRLLALPVPGDDAGAVWRALVDGLPPSETGPPECRAALETILEDGCLAERILAALGLEPGRSAGAEPPRAALLAVYSRLADALRTGTGFRARG